jgi:polyisoprenoid-binding protein YceI
MRNLVINRNLHLQKKPANMQKSIAVLLLLASQALMTPQTRAQAGKWTVDKSHSNVKFTVTHMTVSEVDGRFKVFEGSMDHTKADISDARITFAIDVNSINTDNENRDNHLRGDDFFSVAQYPKITFVGTTLKPLGGNKYQLSGNMTVKDVTKPVTWELTHGGIVNTQRTKPWGLRSGGSVLVRGVSSRRGPTQAQPR